MDDSSNIFLLRTFVNLYKVEHSFPTYLLSVAVVEVFIVELELKVKIRQEDWRRGGGRAVNISVTGAITIKCV